MRKVILSMGGGLTDHSQSPLQGDWDSNITPSSGHTAAQWPGGTGDTYWPQAGLHWPVLLLPHGFLVSASVTQGPPNVTMLHYNIITWQRRRDAFLTLSPSSLSHPTATERQRLPFPFSLTHLYVAAPSVEEGGDLFCMFLLSNTLTLQWSIFILAQLGWLLF